MRKRLFLVVLFAAALVAGRAEAVFIDFESVPGLIAASPTSVGSPVPAEARLSTQLQLGLGVSFTSTPGYVGLANLGFGETTSGVNGIGGVSLSGAFDYGLIEIRFTLPGDPSTPAVTDFASIRGDTVPIAGSATLEAYDFLGGLLTSITVPDTGGATLSLSVQGIHSLRVSSTSGTIAFDDLQFNALTPVPEPASGALVGIAVAALCATRARRRER